VVVCRKTIQRTLPTTCPNPEGPHACVSKGRRIETCPFLLIAVLNVKGQALQKPGGSCLGL
jgi:hypothetical protein